MGRANVYLPDDLERRVKAARIPISEVCQQALLAAVEAAEGDRHPLGPAVGDLYRRGWQAGGEWAGSAAPVTLLALLRDQRLPEIPGDRLPEFWYSLNEEQTTAWEAGFLEAARTTVRAAVTTGLPTPPLRPRDTAATGGAGSGPTTAGEPTDATAAGAAAGAGATAATGADDAGADDAAGGPSLGDSSTCYVGVDRDGHRIAFDPHAALAADKSPLFAVLGPADERARLTLGIGQDAACRGAAVVVLDLSGQVRARAAGLGKNVRVVRSPQQPLPSIDELLHGGASLRTLWDTLAGMSATGGPLFPLPGASADDLVKAGYVTVLSLSGEGALTGALAASHAARALAGLVAAADHPRLLLVDLPTGVTVPGHLAALLTRLVRTAREKDVAFGLSAESAQAVVGVGGSGALLSTVFAFATSSPVEADRLRDLLGAHAPILLTPPGSVPRSGDEAWCVMRDLDGRLGQVRVEAL
ncbi:MAG TPA: hypothetical protein VKP11_01935 [Frankiaceae bacterium]|nr:hypothetical protein [Frankiaceae bacterium]